MFCKSRWRLPAYIPSARHLCAIQTARAFVSIESGERLPKGDRLRYPICLRCCCSAKRKIRDIRYTKIIIVRNGPKISTWITRFGVGVLWIFVTVFFQPGPEWILCILCQVSCISIISYLPSLVLLCASNSAGNIYYAVLCSTDFTLESTPGLPLIAGEGGVDFCIFIDLPGAVWISLILGTVVLCVLSSR